MHWTHQDGFIKPLMSSALEALLVAKGTSRATDVVHVADKFIDDWNTYGPVPRSPVDAYARGRILGANSTKNNLRPPRGRVDPNRRFVRVRGTRPHPDRRARDNAPRAKDSRPISGRRTRSQGPRNRTGEPSTTVVHERGGGSPLGCSMGLRAVLDLGSRHRRGTKVVLDWSGQTGPLRRLGLLTSLLSPLGCSRRRPVL